MRRHELDGLTLVDADAWMPQHVKAALWAGDLTVAEIGVALVGGTHPDSEALSAAGATWCVPEILPGATAAEALGAPQLLPVDGCRASFG